MGSGIARTFAGDRCLDDMLTRWARRAGIGLATSVATVTAAGLALQQCAPTHRPNGERLAIEGVRLHIDCAGEPSGLPTFVAEAGLGLNAQSFHWLQVELQDTARFCRYDRAGMGFSEAGAAGKDADTVARQLRALLRGARIEPPYVMVGHSLGGSYVRVFADRHPNEVAGLVLLDSTHPNQLERLHESVEERAAVLRALAVAADLGWVNLLATTFGGLADDGLPEREAAVNRSFYRVGKDVRTTAEELESSPAVFARAARCKDLGARPVLVITAGRQLPDTSAAWMAMQHDLTRLSTHSRHFVVPEADHVSLLTRRGHAQLVASKIRELYPELRLADR